MRVLELKDNELYLDGKKLRYITEFSIDYEAETPTDRHYCRLVARGFATKDGKLIVDDFGEYTQYFIDEIVLLANVGKSIEYKF